MSLDDLKAVKAEINRLREEAKVKAKELFEKSSLDLFTAHKELESFSWTQYTPYFNDGNPCEFSSNAEYADINGSEIPWDKAKRTAIHKDVVNFLSHFDDDDYLSMFGDHAKVTVTKEGVTVGECEHE